MKRLIAILLLVGAFQVQAADVTITVPITVPDASVARLSAYVIALPNMYTYETNVVGGVTNVVATVVPETTKEKFKRHASRFLTNELQRRVRKFEENAARKAVTTIEILEQ